MRLMRFVKSLEIRQDFIGVISVQLDVGPDHLLWVIDLVHNQPHDKINHTIRNSIYLNRE